MVGKFMAKVIAEVQDWADVKLRRLCGRITPDQRVVVILVMLVVFGGLSVYMTVAAVYNIGKSDGRELGIESINGLRLKNDSIINPFNNQ